MNGQLFSIQTKDRHRAELWQRLFNLDALPVVTNRARWQDINGRNAYAYDLDLARLSEHQRNRFAGYVAGRTGRSYAASVKPEIDSRQTYPVEASGCIVVLESTENVSEDETAVQHRRPFFFDWLARLFPPRIVYG